MKKMSTIAAVLMTLLLVVSCASTGATGGNGSAPAVDKNGLIFRSESQYIDKLAEHQLASLTVGTGNVGMADISDWSKIRMTCDFLDALNLNAELTTEEKVELMSYLFDDLPVPAEDGVVREVYMGKFFSNGQGGDDNLTIRVSFMYPTPSASMDVDYVLLLVTNALNIEGEINRQMGYFISLDMNACVAGIQKDSLVTNLDHAIAEDLNAVDPASLSGFDAIMYSQSILADEDLSNDIRAHELCTALMTDYTQMPAIIVTAMMIEYDYQISLGNLEAAEAMWTNIIDYCPMVPGDMTPENLEATNGVSRHLLRALQSR